MAIARLLFGPDHLETAVSYAALAVLLERKGNVVAADSFARAALAVKIRWAARQRGDLQLAERLYRRAVTLYQAELPDGHPYLAQGRDGLRGN